MGAILLSLTYLGILVVVVTGVVRMIAPGNNVVRQLHAAASPFASFVFAIYYLMFQLAPAGPYQRILMALCLILLLYTGLATGKTEPSRTEKIVHLVAGMATFLLFSFVYFSFILLQISGGTPAPNPAFP